MVERFDLTIFFCFVTASIATLGSLFFSDIMQFVPCTMCWYQRIFMYPLVIIFLIALLYPDDKVFKYSIVLVLIGWGFSIYHNLLMFGIISEEMVPCTQGVPCGVKYIDWFGFVSIPLLSFIAYSLILVLLYINKKNKAKKEKA
ncbi:MAG: disulfide bond formation protein B [Aliarcobacter sp.]|jgi:disulfide bond formation protein DsbB|nr:disulfide bond formation protein B [Aliarcobacter sp.]